MAMVLAAPSPCSAMASSSLSFTRALSPSLTSISSSPSSCLSTPSLQSSLPSLSSYPTIVCGRGDKKTAKGKRFKGSYGNSRPRKANKGTGLSMIPLPPRPPKKDPLDDGEFIEIIIDDNLFAKKA